MKRRWIGAVIVFCGVSTGAWTELLPSGQDEANLPTTVKIDIGQMFVAADTNHDELVSFQEAHTYNFLVSQSQFDTYDLNHDGCIDRAEAGLPLTEAQFHQYDSNHDSVIDRTEGLPQSMFDHYDTDLDNLVTRVEAGLPAVDPNPVDPGNGGCSGCSGSKSWPANGDLFTMALSLLGLAAMAKARRP